MDRMKTCMVNRWLFTWNRRREHFDNGFLFLCEFTWFWDFSIRECSPCCYFQPFLLAVKLSSVACFLGLIPSSLRQVFSGTSLGNLRGTWVGFFRPLFFTTGSLLLSCSTRILVPLLVYGGNSLKFVVFAQVIILLFF